MSELISVTVCPAEELQDGQRKLVKVDATEIAIFNLKGQLYAVRNKCPHQGVPMVYGTVSGTMLPSDPHTYQYGRHEEILRCPLHGWGFDIKTGESIFNDAHCRLKTYDVRQEGDSIVLYLAIEPKRVSLVETHASIVS
ncbi:Rieske (2Fe-2S) protein [Niallia oryzisoli]|uniref:Rieske (2Fe-2S) protein n=1 Tax=Niallia oryzisoli TaxID=1737571 RepID=UPI003734E6A9